MRLTNILIVGVGGQGTLLTSKVLGNLAMEAGYEVKVSELHGMAQRGGRRGYARSFRRQGSAPRSSMKAARTSYWLLKSWRPRAT